MRRLIQADPLRRNLILDSRTSSGHPASNNLSHSSGFFGGTLKTTKARAATVISDPVWCHRCSIRIAPYDIRTTYNGKPYHRGCYVKLHNEKAQDRKN
jgi:hypothetical protein